MCRTTDGMTPLIMATLEGEGHGQGHLDVVRALLGHPQIDPNIATIQGSDSATALYYASEAGHPDYVRLLIGHHKTDVNKGKTDGRTPLYRLKKYPQIDNDSMRDECFMGEKLNHPLP